MINPIYDNPDFLVVDKPANLACIPEGEKGKDCLLQKLEEQFAQKLFIVHRLDKEASGIMIFAKNAETHKYLSELFDLKTIKRTYLALVHGRVKDARGVIKNKLREFGSGRMGVDPVQGKEAITNYERIKAYQNMSLLRAMPETVRRHQLRVHFYGLDHPIVGDRKYGNKAIQAPFNRLMLHAESLEFNLPDGTPVKFESATVNNFLNQARTLAYADSEK